MEIAIIAAIVICVGVLVVAGIGVLIYFMRKGSAQKDDTSE